MNLKHIIIILVTKVCLFLCEDYYDLLGISRDANNREIRKAFKKLALKLHPDKNTAEGAHEDFLKINRAYEILKDEDTRKKYDMFGEEGFKDNQGGRNYESWSYYHSDFGIYDDDPEIVTLDTSDFQQSVLESHDIWFINFYSPHCSHCHDLAPTWRRVAKQLTGVIRVGAVNCQEEYMLCRRQGITGYPSLNLYSMDGTKKYQARREEEDLMEFVSRYIPDQVVNLWSGNFAKWTIGEEGGRNGPWLFMLCYDQFGCPDSIDRKLVAATLYGLARVGLVDCDQDRDICARLGAVGERGEFELVFYPDGVSGQEEPGEEEVNRKRIQTAVFDHKDIVREVLEYIPGPSQLDEDKFRAMVSRLDRDIGPGWLVHFVRSGEGESAAYKKLIPLVPRLKIGQVDCATARAVCNEYYITKYPSFVVFKPGGHYELNYGKTGVEDVATFARLASQARTMQTLTRSDFPDVLTSGQPIFLDFFAPWCPPCMNLLPEFRKASTLIGGNIMFGTVDCTIHNSICNQHSIRAYPTTIFFNSSKPHKFSGGHDAESLADFVTDVLRPTVVDLTQDNFHKLVGAKTESEMWLVDFFAPWCGPCQQLAPHWRTLGRLMEKRPNVKLGKVDCVEESELCHAQGVIGYPTIRMYPLNTLGTSRYYKYEQYHRDADSLQQWVNSNLPSHVENITPYSFKQNVIKSAQPWLLKFYAPWCSHCTQFAPDYEQVAVTLLGVAKVGKVNCEKYKQLCSQAGITGYPTLRFYRGADKHDVQEYYSQNIETRDPPAIVRLVEEGIKMSALPGAQPQDSRHDEL